MFTNKQYSSFFSNHTNIKLIKKIKAETMSTPSLWENTIFRVSQYRTRDIHRGIETLGQFEREQERERQRKKVREKERETEFEADIL